MTTQYRIKQTMSDIFDIDIDSIYEKTSSDDILKWDSLNHIRLILALEAEFEIELSPEESMDMLSVNSITKIIEDKIR